MIGKLLQLVSRRPAPASAPRFHGAEVLPPDAAAIGLIAGNGPFPFDFARAAKTQGRRIIAVCHQGETAPEIEREVDVAVWIKVGELGRLIAAFKEHDVRYAAMAGGINRVRLFGGVKLDLRGAALLARIRSTKDDVIMRAIADELSAEGIEIVACTVFSHELLVEQGILTRHGPSSAELADIAVGSAAIRAMSSQDIGQVVVVKDGVVVAVEAVEGTDATIKRGGDLGGPGCVVVKFAKVTQDMRFDVPTVGTRTIEGMAAAKARVLALEAGRCVMLNRAEVLDLAERHGISIVGCEPLAGAGNAVTESSPASLDEPSRSSP